MLEKEVKVNEGVGEEAKELEEMAQLKGFRLLDVQGGMHVELRKSQGDTEVLVQFKGRSLKEKELEEERESDLVESKMEEGEGVDYEDICYFTVFLTKGEESVAYECLGVDSELVVNHVVNLGGDIDNYKAQTRLERNSYQYLGPDFHSLDMHLQGALRDYLLTHGVDSQVCQLVMEYSLLKDARLYLHWAKSMHTFLA